MAVLVKRNRIILQLRDKENKKLKVEYVLHESELAVKWANKIKHLQHLDFDHIQSNYAQPQSSDLKTYYKKFCKIAGIEYDQEMDLDRQENLNHLHELFEKNHDRLSIIDPDALYAFHIAIHTRERKQVPLRLTSGWGVKEGMLSEKFNCNRFYESEVKRNQLYLDWSELGKKPYTYWKNNEPSNQTRVNELCKPHMTFRAQFFVAGRDITPVPLDRKFETWFDTYKQPWLDKYGLDKWDHIDEQSAPLLATTTYTGSLDNYKVIGISYENNYR